MKESLVFPGFESFDTAYDNINNSSYGLDPQINFTEFLEEARRYANEKKQHQKEGEESGTKKQVTYEEKKCRKKSWKNALFSFWRSSSSDKKANKQHSDEKSRASHNAANPKPRGHFSGPVFGVKGAVAGGGKQNRLAASGPLTGLFQQKRWKEKKGNEIPYVSLEKLNKPLYDAKTYGPVYSVS